MSRWSALGLVMMLACHPVDDAVDDGVVSATEACQKAVDEAVDQVKAEVVAEVWALCSAAYEQVQQDLQETYEQGCLPYLDGLLSSYLTTHGCKKTGNASVGVVWVCTATDMCPSEAVP
jgi:hypothetical protein